MIERYIRVYQYGSQRLEKSVTGWLAHKGRLYHKGNTSTDKGVCTVNANPFSLLERKLTFVSRLVTLAIKNLNVPRSGK